MSVLDAAIQKKKIDGSETIVLVISNGEMGDIMRMVKLIEKSGLLIKGISKAIKNKAKEQKGGFLQMLLGTLSAGTLGKSFAKKEVIRASQVLAKSSKGPNVWDLPETFRILSGDQYKNWWFNKKLFFRCNSSCIYIYSSFYRKIKYSKVLNGEVRRTSQGPNDGTFWEHPRDVSHTGFLNSTRKHIKLILTGYSRFYEWYSS